jgi:hypothetical protein
MKFCPNCETYVIVNHRYCDTHLEYCSTSCKINMIIQKEKDICSVCGENLTTNIYDDDIINAMNVINNNLL